MQSSNLNVCLFPMEIFWGDKEKNLQTLKDKIKEIHPETDLLILPETFSTGFPSGEDKEKIRILAEKNTGQTMDLIKELSQQYNLAISGSFIANSGGLLYNRAFFIEPSGDEYFADKRHLFAPGGENKIFTKGHYRLSLRFRGWNIVMIVCYDLRFPVWCRNRNNEYDLMIAVANWPVSRIDVWNQLLKSRAIENLSYVCGVDCKGIDSGGHEYDGSSAVFDYKGKNISIAINNDGLLYATLSKTKLEDFRKKFPAWEDNDNFNIIL